MKKTDILYYLFIVIIAIGSITMLIKSNQMKNEITELYQKK